MSCARTIAVVGQTARLSASGPSRSPSATASRAAIARTKSRLSGRLGTLLLKQIHQITLYFRQVADKLGSQGVPVRALSRCALTDFDLGRRAELGWRGVDTLAAQIASIETRATIVLPAQIGGLVLLMDRLYGKSGRLVHGWHHFVGVCALFSLGFGAVAALDIVWPMLPERWFGRELKAAPAVALPSLRDEQAFAEFDELQFIASLFARSWAIAARYELALRISLALSGVALGLVGTTLLSGRAFGF